MTESTTGRVEGAGEWLEGFVRVPGKVALLLGCIKGTGNVVMVNVGR